MISRYLSVDYCFHFTNHHSELGHGVFIIRGDGETTLLKDHELVLRS